MLLYGFSDSAYTKQMLCILTEPNFHLRHAYLNLRAYLPTITQYELWMRECQNRNGIWKKAVFYLYGPACCLVLWPNGIQCHLSFLI